MKVAELFEKKDVHPMDIPGARKKWLAYVKQCEEQNKPHKSFGSWALYNKDKLAEEIKGWKHAGRDIAKARAEKGKDVKLVRLKKDGTESKMNDATRMFRSEEEARRHHENMVKLNPKSSIKHNLYIDGKAQLLEDVIKPDEAGWYVCDAKERPHHGPMSESKAKALADQLSVDGKKYTAEYFSDYEISRMDEGKTPTKTYGRGSQTYWVEVYDERRNWGDVVAIRANSQQEVEEFCSKHGWEVQGLELMEGLFGKKKESKNEPITADDRKLIKSFFKSGHNADLKSGDGPLFPDNVHVVTNDKHISFYKRGGQLKASVGHHRPGEAGDPKKRPLVHTDHDINSAEDLKKLVEGVAPPFQRFKKGQIVTVKKTGQKVEVLSQNDIGLVQTVSTDPTDRKIKSWRDYSAATLKRGLVSGAGHQEYMPRELEA